MTEHALTATAVRETRCGRTPGRRLRALLGPSARQVVRRPAERDQSDGDDSGAPQVRCPEDNTWSEDAFGQRRVCEPAELVGGCESENPAAHGYQRETSDEQEHGKATWLHLVTVAAGWQDGPAGALDAA